MAEVATLGRDGVQRRRFRPQTDTQTFQTTTAEGGAVIDLLNVEQGPFPPGTTPQVVEFRARNSGGIDEPINMAVDEINQDGSLIEGVCFEQSDSVPPGECAIIENVATGGVTDCIPVVDDQCNATGRLRLPLSSSRGETQRWGVAVWSASEDIPVPPYSSTTMAESEPQQGDIDQFLNEFGPAIAAGVGGGLIGGIIQNELQ